LLGGVLWVVRAPRTLALGTMVLASLVPNCMRFLRASLGAMASPCPAGRLGCFAVTEPISWHLRAYARHSAATGRCGSVQVSRVLCVAESDSALLGVTVSIHPGWMDTGPCACRTLTTLRVPRQLQPLIHNALCAGQTHYSPTPFSGSPRYKKGRPS